LIIRRIVESLRARNFSLFAAELIIVVVGVFIGLQASNWNDSRVDRNRAHSYLERIRNDLDADLINYRDRMKFWSDVSAYGAQALNYANSGSLDGLTEWDLLLAYFQASQLAEHFTTRSTYDELKSAGELGLISNLELRIQLARYYTFADNPVLTERPAYREHVRGIIPMNIQRYIWENCYAVVDDNQVLEACDAPIAPQESARIIEGLRGNTKLTSELRYWMSTMQVAVVMGTGNVEIVESLRSLMDENIED
jgi:hypothetical protein